MARNTSELAGTGVPLFSSDFLRRLERLDLVTKKIPRANAASAIPMVMARCSSVQKSSLL